MGSGLVLFYLFLFILILFNCITFIFYLFYFVYYLFIFPNTSLPPEVGGGTKRAVLEENVFAILLPVTEPWEGMWITPIPTFGGGLDPPTTNFNNKLPIRSYPQGQLESGHVFLFLYILAFLYVFLCFNGLLFVYNLMPRFLSCASDGFRTAAFHRRNPSQLSTRSRGVALLPGGERFVRRPPELLSSDGRPTPVRGGAGQGEQPPGRCASPHPLRQGLAPSDHFQSPSILKTDVFSIL